MHNNQSFEALLSKKILREPFGLDFLINRKKVLKN